MKPIIKESEYLYTLDEVAERLNISRSMVGDAQRSGLHKLRLVLAERGYTVNDFLEACNEKLSLADRSARRSDEATTTNSTNIH